MLRFLVILGLLWGGVALGAPTPGPAQVQAKQEYEAGVAAFKAKRFDVALARFEAAYQLDPVPTLLFNLGRVHEERGATAEAIAHFERYLTREPAAGDRAEVEARLLRLRGRTAPAPTPAGGIPPWVGWSALGLAVAGATVGGVFLASAADAQSEAEDLRPTVADRARYDDLQSRFERDRAFGWIGLAAGAAFAVTGAAVLVWGGRSAPSQVALSPTVGGVSLGVTF